MFNRSVIKKDLVTARHALKQTVLTLLVVGAASLVLFGVYSFLRFASFDVLGLIVSVVCVALVTCLGYWVVYEPWHEQELPDWVKGALALGAVAVLIWFRHLIPLLGILLLAHVAAFRWVNNEHGDGNRKRFAVAVAALLFALPQLVAWWVLTPMRRGFHGEGFGDDMTASAANQAAIARYMPAGSPSHDYVSDNDILNARDNAVRSWGMTPVGHNWWYSGRYAQRTMIECYTINPLAFFDSASYDEGKEQRNKWDSDYSY